MTSLLEHEENTQQSENPQQSTISITIRLIDQNAEGEDELIKVTRHPNE